jgi:hypothetical protein
MGHANFLSIAGQAYYPFTLSNETYQPLSGNSLDLLDDTIKSIFSGLKTLKEEARQIPAKIQTALYHRQYPHLVKVETLNPSIMNKIGAVVKNNLLQPGSDLVEGTKAYHKQFKKIKTKMLYYFNQQIPKSVKTGMTSLKGIATNENIQNILLEDSIEHAMPKKLTKKIQQHHTQKQLNCLQKTAASLEKQIKTVQEDYKDVSMTYEQSLNLELQHESLKDFDSKVARIEQAITEMGKFISEVKKHQKSHPTHTPESLLKGADKANRALGSFKKLEKMKKEMKQRAIAITLTEKHQAILQMSNKFKQSRFEGQLDENCRQELLKNIKNYLDAVGGQNAALYNQLCSIEVDKVKDIQRFLDKGEMSNYIPSKDEAKKARFKPLQKVGEHKSSLSIDIQLKSFKRQTSHLEQVYHQRVHTVMPIPRFTSVAA